MRRLLLLATLLTIACGLNDFPPSSLVSTVRILASRADKPYAKPGDAVHVDVLAVDGRANPSTPMKVYWIPVPCINPKNDAYYNCFQTLAGLAGGAGSGAGAGLKPGVDLTPYLPQGTGYDVTLPADIISSHKPTPGSPPYGIAVVFNVACAGHLEILPPSGNNNPQAPPIACFDGQENQLGADDYVFGLARLYAYDTLTNANPVIDHLAFQGNTIDPNAGITMPHCTGDNGGQCDNLEIDVVVPPSSDEVNPGDVDPDGTVHHEEIWADFYVTTGKIDQDASLLYDARAGQVTGNPNHYQAPGAPTEGKMWVVVHDNRGGAAWVELPIHAQ